MYMLCNRYFCIIIFINDAVDESRNEEHNPKLYNTRADHQVLWYSKSDTIGIWQVEDTRGIQKVLSLPKKKLHYIQQWNYDPSHQQFGSDVR